MATSGKAAYIRLRGVLVSAPAAATLAQPCRGSAALAFGARRRARRDRGLAQRGMAWPRAVACCGAASAAGASGPVAPGAGAADVPGSRRRQPGGGAVGGVAAGPGALPRGGGSVRRVENRCFPGRGLDLPGLRAGVADGSVVCPGARRGAAGAGLGAVACGAVAALQVPRWKPRPVCRSAPAHRGIAGLPG